MGSHLAFAEEFRPAILGVVGVEIRAARKLYLMKAGGANVYGELLTRGLSERTPVVSESQGFCDFTEVRSILHIPVVAIRDPTHPFNLVQIRLKRFSEGAGSSGAQDVGEISLHLHEIIRCSPVKGWFDLFNESFYAGQILVRVTFTYGLYGYGHSNQLPKRLANGRRSQSPPPEEDDEHNVMQFVLSQIKHSLYPRICPPIERTDGDGVSLVPIKTPHPDFIPFIKKAPDLRNLKQGIMEAKAPPALGMIQEEKEGDGDGDAKKEGGEDTDSAALLRKAGAQKLKEAKKRPPPETHRNTLTAASLSESFEGKPVREPIGKLVSRESTASTTSEGSIFSRGSSMIGRMSLLKTARSSVASGPRGRMSQTLSHVVNLNRLKNTFGPRSSIANDSIAENSTSDVAIANGTATTTTPTTVTPFNTSATATITTTSAAGSTTTADATNPTTTSNTVASSSDTSTTTTIPTTTTTASDSTDPTPGIKSALVSTNTPATSRQTTQNLDPQARASKRLMMALQAFSSFDKKGKTSKAKGVESQKENSGDESSGGEKGDGEINATEEEGRFKQPEYPELVSRMTRLKSLTQKLGTIEGRFDRLAFLHQQIESTNRKAETVYTNDEAVDAELQAVHLRHGYGYILSSMSLMRLFCSGFLSGGEENKFVLTCMDKINDRNPHNLGI